MVRLMRAIEAAKGDARGLSPEAAAERLRYALRQEGAYLPPEALRRWARSWSDPWWPVRHPVKALREMRSTTRPALDEDMEGEAAELSARIRKVFDRRRYTHFTVESHRTMDGLKHRVRFAPWSESTARKIVEAAGWIAVEVSPADPQ